MAQGSIVGILKWMIGVVGKLSASRSSLHLMSAGWFAFELSVFGERASVLLCRRGVS
jgi:hypothetical protein